MTDETTTTSNATGTEKKTTEHVLTALEAYWMETQLVYDPDSNGSSNTEIIQEESVQGVDTTKHAWEYTCSCGEEFTDFETATDHLEEKS